MRKRAWASSASSPGTGPATRRSRCVTPPDAYSGHSYREAFQTKASFPDAHPMLGLTKQIDVVLKEPGELEWRVVLEVHKSEWSRSRAVWLLEEKLNAYAGFVLDGHMRSLYPRSAPEHTRIVIASVDPLPEEAVMLLEKAAAALNAHAVKLSWTLEGGMPEAGVPPPAGFVDPGAATS